MGIRYLIFKNWSGNHLEIELCDRGYKYRFTNGVAGLIKHLLEENGFVEGFGQEGLIVWNIGVIGSAVYQSLGAYQKINHFPKSFEITRKDLMLQNLSKMKHRFAREYNFYPQTFILPAEGSIFAESAEKQKEERWYIVKPHNSSQGKGIWLSNSHEEILQKQKECIVVSEYIHNPLLANGLKFDMRLYVAITCWNPLRIYLYDDGLTRFATAPYTFDLSSKDNLFAHLTNYSLNKFADNFEPNDDQDECKGHKWSHFALRDYLRQQGHDVATAWARIDDLIIKSVLSIENTVFSAMEMSVPYRTNCFEVLGFDILLDSLLRPWLLEVNLSPSLNTDSPLDLKIKGQMIADLFTMIGVVPPDQQFGVDKSYLLNQNKLTPKELKNEYSKLERLVLRESEEEEKRYFIAKAGPVAGARSSRQKTRSATSPSSTSTARSTGCCARRSSRSSRAGTSRATTSTRPCATSQKTPPRRIPDSQSVINNHSRSTASLCSPPAPPAGRGSQSMRTAARAWPAG